MHVVRGRSDLEINAKQRRAAVTAYRERNGNDLTSVKGALDAPTHDVRRYIDNVLAVNNRGDCKSH